MKVLLALTVLGVAAALPAQAPKTVVIANRSMGAVTLSTEDVRTIFTGGEVHLPGGIRPVPVLLREGPVQQLFLKDYIGKVDASFRSGWRSLVFSGQATMPRSAEDEAEMISYVAHTPGAIGYVSRASVHEGVLVVTVR